jgi:hypothetical protein
MLVLIQIKDHQTLSDNIVALIGDYRVLTIKMFKDILET